MNNQSQGAAMYTPVVLSIYDFWALRILNKFAWGCSTTRVLLPFFKTFVSKNHLDVGSGTAFYPRHAMSTGKLTLLDIDKGCLDYAKQRCGKLSVTTICQDATWPFHRPQQFDSISIFHLLHCVQKEVYQREVVIINLKENLAEGGVLFGATILGRRADHNWFGSLLMDIYNDDGIFENEDDTVDDLHEMLSKHFVNVSINTVGRVALFTAVGKKMDRG